METRRSEALILRLRGLGESDLLADLFTPEMGRATALVKGGKRSKKRFFGLLLTGHFLDVQLAPPRKGSDLWRLEAASLLAPHVGLRQDFRRLIAASPVWELLLRATAPHDPHAPALDLALATLARLDKTRETAGLASALAAYLVRLLKELGYGLSLDACLICGRPSHGAKATRLSMAGGLVCGLCPHESTHHGGAAVWDVPAGLVKGLAAAQEMELGALGRLRFPAAVLKPSLAFLTEFWRRVAAHDLPSLEVAQRFFNKRL
jgi:DNA repair protein RecO (recombination protein O)